MNADRLITPYTNKVVFGTLPNGAVFWGAGPYRHRYCPIAGADIQEVKWNGVWYIDTIALDSAIDMTGHTVSDVQDIEG